MVEDNWYNEVLREEGWFDMTDDQELTMAEIEAVEENEELSAEEAVAQIRALVAAAGFTPLGGPERGGKRCGGNCNCQCKK